MTTRPPCPANARRHMREDHGWELAACWAQNFLALADAHWAEHIERSDLRHIHDDGAVLAV